MQGPVLLSQGFCKQFEQLNRGNGAGLVFHQRLLAALEQQRAGNVAPGGEVGRLEALTSTAVLTMGPGSPWACTP